MTTILDPWTACPEHGPHCSGDTCCCADKHPRDAMKAVRTPIGDVVVLPPCELSHRHDDECWQLWGVVGRAGDTVDVGEECPTCGGRKRIDPWDRPTTIGWPYGWQCRTCGGSGTVSVPYVVREVLPIVDRRTRVDGRHVVIDALGDAWLFDRSKSSVESPMYLGHLPDAQPGGVALVVERAK